MYLLFKSLMVGFGTTALLLGIVAPSSSGQSVGLNMAKLVCVYLLTPGILVGTALGALWAFTWLVNSLLYSLFAAIGFNLWARVRQRWKTPLH